MIFPFPLQTLTNSGREPDSRMVAVGSSGTWEKGVSDIGDPIAAAFTLLFSIPYSYSHLRPHQRQRCSGRVGSIARENFFRLRLPLLPRTVFKFEFKVVFALWTAASPAWWQQINLARLYLGQGANVLCLILNLKQTGGTCTDYVYQSREKDGYCQSNWPSFGEREN